MKFFNIYISFLLLAVISQFLSCKTRTNTPEGVVQAIQDLAGSGKLDEIRMYMSSGSMSQIDAINKMYPGLFRWEAEFQRRFATGSSWKMEEKKISGDRAVMTLLCVKHPVENIQGLKTVIRLKLEGGQWKIDMEDGIRRASSRLADFEKRPDSKRFRQ